MLPLIRRTLVAAALTATCGTLLPPASAADLRPVLALTPTAAGPVKIGTSTRIGEPTLRRAIGNPTKVVNGGCEFANEHARNLSWGPAGGGQEPAHPDQVVGGHREGELPADTV